MWWCCKILCVDLEAVRVRAMPCSRVDVRDGSFVGFAGAVDVVFTQ
jgi:hypothetical protein